MIPVAPGIPATTPRAENRASSVPSRTRMRAPQAARMSATRCFPLRASRTAGSGDELGVADAEHLGETGESGHRPGRLLHGLRIEEGAGGEPAGERAEHPFVVERDEGILQLVEDHEPDGIRADVDHGHRTGVRGPRHGEGGELHQARVTFLTTRCFPRAPPRPDRLGWVMKYSWAENAFLRGLVRM